jgi:predicted membrane-bound spermidine synthase
VRYCPITFQGGLPALGTLIDSILLLLKKDMETLDEVQPWGITQYTIIPGSHISFHTKRAKIDFITNPHFGRMLFIDGILQCAQADEHIYHEAIVESSNAFAAASANPVAEAEAEAVRVLIAGGAEGAVVRELLKYPNVQSITMVDWDEELVNHMRTESFAKGSFESPLLTIKHTDIIEFLTYTDEIFHTMILDLLDPQSNDEVKWLSAVTHLAFTHLAYGGTLVLNAGGNYERVFELKELVSKGNTYEIYEKEIFVPSFQEMWYLITVRRRI